MDLDSHDGTQSPPPFEPGLTLSINAPRLDDSSEYDEDEHKMSIRELFRTRSVRGEVIGIMHNAVPISFSSLCRMGLLTTDVAFIGHLGTDELSGATLALAWINPLMDLFTTGGNVSLNMLCSQSLGAKNHELVGVWFQMSIIWGILMSTITVILTWLLVEPIVGYFAPDRYSVDMAVKFARWSCLWIWPATFYQGARQYFQAHGITRPAAITSGVCLIANFGFNYMFIWGLAPVWLGLSLTGSPVATTASYALQNLLFLTWCLLVRKHHKKSWKGWNFRMIFHIPRIIQYLRQSIPIGLQILLDETGYAILTMLIGKILKDNVEVASQAILMNVWAVLWGFFWGVGLSTQLRIAHALGKGDINQTRFALVVGFVLVLAVVSIVGLLAVLLREPITHLFSHDSNVIRTVSRTFPLMIVTWALNSVTLMFVSTLEGAGRPTAATVITAVAQWLVGFPLAIVFGFVLDKHLHLGLRGVWIGTSIGEVLKLVLATVVLFCFTDWEKMARDARHRSETSALLSPTSSFAVSKEELHQDKNRSTL